MKKIFAFAVILALLLPAAAFAAAEFTLGGFVKLDTFWDSTQSSKNMLTPIARNNDPSFHHGRVKFTAQGSRFNLTIKGPNLWGAKTSGFIEMDFDSEQQLGLGSANADNASQNYKPRLRHAMFRFNWPTTELLFGQYWSMFCEFYSENVQDGPLMGHGMPTARLAQVRVSQMFGDGFTIAGLIGNPNNITGAAGATPNYNNPNNGENAEMPQVQAKLMYQKDLWGKAAYYGAPMPFTARVIGGWQRNVLRASTNAVANQVFSTNTFGQNGFGTANGLLSNHQYLNPWMIMGNVFLPILPTHSANLAGTASLSAQAYLGQGLGAFGEGMGNDVFATFQNQTWVNNRTNYAYEQQLYKKFGGYVQGQYYFTNHWFANVTGGYSRIYGVDRSLNNAARTVANPAGYVWAGGDQPSSWTEVDFTLWYRPIQAFKFGLQYAWQRTSWLQVTSTGAAGANTSNVGNSSRVEFVGFFYF
jgi:hypothetical protein